jgi:hypothetical protein
MKAKPWEIEGKSRTSYFRHRKMAKNGQQPREYQKSHIGTNSGTDNVINIDGTKAKDAKPKPKISADMLFRARMLGAKPEQSNPFKVNTNFMPPFKATKQARMALDSAFQALAPCLDWAGSGEAFGNFASFAGGFTRYRISWI